MKAIIIEEVRFVEILEDLKYHAESLASNVTTPDRIGWDRAMWAAAVQECHRQLHFRLVQWMQSHGASCIR